MAPALVQAQAFPTKTVRIVVPYPPGGPTDALARMLANEMQATLGHAVIVENKPGGAASIGTRFVAKGAADGHTLVLGAGQSHVSTAVLIKDAGYDPVKDFAPIAGLTSLRQVLVVKNDLPVKSVPDLVALAKKDPGKLNYGSTGIGSGTHLAMELFKQRTGTDMTHIPYQGAGPMTGELIAGRLDLAFATLPSVLGHIKSGGMRAIGLASAERAAQLPDVALLKEQGVADSEADSWLALFAPAAAPAEARDKLTKAVMAAMATPALTEGAAKFGFVVTLRDPAAFGSFHSTEMGKWAAVIKAAKVEAQ